jgi:hypothetical protein
MVVKLSNFALGLYIPKDGNAPHFLDVIEFPNFWTEQVDDNVSGVNQNPVALSLPFNRQGANTTFLDFYTEMIGHCTDMAL